MKTTSMTALIIGCALCQTVAQPGGQNCEYDDPSLLIEPRAYLRAVVGDSNLKNAELADGGHDPRHDGFSIPTFSLGADILYGEHLGGFVDGILSWNDEDGWNEELEEFYVKLMNIPGGFDMKAGRLLVAAGTQNNIHNHAWKFVDANLANVRFLGDDGLALEGVEFSWRIPTHWDDRLILSFGSVVKHGHEDAPSDESVHHHGEEAEEALWNQNVLTVRYQATLWPSDACQFIYGVSYVQGKNSTSKTTRLYGLDLSCRWLQDEGHGKELTWRNEVMLRRGHTDEGRFEEFSFSSSALYQLNSQWEIGLRYEYLEGVDDPGLPERHRISPAISQYFQWRKTEAMARLQYNYDHSGELGAGHSIWFQFGFEWGVDGEGHVH